MRGIRKTLETIRLTAMEDRKSYELRLGTLPKQDSAMCQAWIEEETQKIEWADAQLAELEKKGW